MYTTWKCSGVTHIFLSYHVPNFMSSSDKLKGAYREMSPSIKLPKISTIMINDTIQYGICI